MNVLIFYTDQQQRGSMGAYGNRTVKTPNLDRWASGAAVFEAGVCPQPVCVPSRCSTYAGVYPHQHGVFDNYHRLPRRFPTLGDMVIDRVRTGFLGKWHLGNEVLPQRGFEEFYHAVDDDYTSGKDFPLYGLCGYGRWLVEKGYEPDSPNGKFTREFCARLPEKDSKPAFISEQGCKFIECRKEEPFLLVCSFLEPHNPYHSEYDDLHDPAEIELPANFHMEPLEDWPRRNARFQKWATSIPHSDEEAKDTEDKWRDVIARYYGCCHIVDRHAGRVLDKLDELGLRDDTMIVYTSDHGDMMGGHGIYMKSMMYEESAGVPFIVSHPDVTEGRRIAEPVSQVDLVPTILDALGIDGPGHLAGKSLMPLLRGERDEDPDAVAVCEWNGINQNMFSKHDLFADVGGEWIRSIRTKQWKLNVHTGDLSELYDLENDPDEMKNLINDSGHRKVVDRLFARLLEWQRETGDIIELPNPRESAASPATPKQR